MHSVYMDRIKDFEGFSARASWDYAQHTNGFGTKALYPGETISREEAQKRFESEIAQARKIVDANTDGLDEGTKAALTSLTFNAGPRWIKAGLGEAVRAQDVEAIRQRFMEYTKAQGQVLPGLVNRRTAEAAWIGQPAAGEVPVEKAAAGASASIGMASVAPSAVQDEKIAVATSAPDNIRPAIDSVFIPAARPLGSQLAARELWSASSPNNPSELSVATLEALPQPLLEALFDLQLKLILPKPATSKA